MKQLKRREFIKQASLGVTALTAGPLFSSCRRQTANGDREAKRPNILFILTDNQRWDLMGCAGNPIIQTPNMDSLAQKGVMFSKAFVTTPICAASRASILTGLYESSHRFTFRSPPFRADLAAMSYPALMKAAGYRTGFIGKFGLGEHPNVKMENKEETLSSMFDLFDNYHFYPDGYFIKQPDGSEKHLTDLTEEKSISFLKACEQDQPFCLTVSFNAPHALDDDPQQYIWPRRADGLYEDVTFPEPVNSDPAFYEAMPEFMKNSENRKRWHWRFDTPEKYQKMMKGLYRMTSGVDMALGSILKQLEAMGAADNTIIILFSDNGMFYGERGLSDCWTMHEESIHVPYIIYDPRADKKNRDKVVDELVLNVDLSPTILDLAGIDIPEQVHGCSMAPFLRGEDPEWRSDFYCELLWHAPKPKEMQASSGSIPENEGLRTKQWKYIRWFSQQPVYEELYDLKNDPYESVNLAGDPKYTAKLNELRKRCDQLHNQYAPDKP